jgi:hypothetical protein
MTINMWQGCEVWASSLMPGAVVVEEEWKMIAKMFQEVGGGEGGEGGEIMGVP